MQRTKVSANNIELSCYILRASKAQLASPSSQPFDPLYSPNLVFVHGNSQSSDCFLPQFADEGLAWCNRIALDLPGHGLSQHLQNPDLYTIPSYAQTLRAVCKILGLRNLVLVGWSLGGHIVLEILQDIPECKGICIYGTPPLNFPPAMDRAFYPNPALSYGFTATLSEAQAGEYASNFLHQARSVADQPFIRDILTTDPLAREGLAKSIRPGGYADEVAILAQSTIPVAIFHGEHDRFVQLDYLRSLEIPRLWNNKVEVIPHAGHAAHWENPVSFNTMLNKFVRDII